MPGSRGLLKLRSSALHNTFIPHPTCPSPLLIQSIPQPIGISTQYSPCTIRLKSEKDTTYRVTDRWSGASTEDHIINKVKKGDTTDPQAEAAVFGQQERKENMGIADRTKSQATTERDLGRNNKRAKEDHPKAPEPIIGMNDEKGQVSLYSLDVCIQYSQAIILVPSSSSRTNCSESGQLTPDSLSDILVSERVLTNCGFGIL